MMGVQTTVSRGREKVGVAMLGAGELEVEFCGQTMMRAANVNLALGVDSSAPPTSRPATHPLTHPSHKSQPLLCRQQREQAHHTESTCQTSKGNVS